MDQQKPIHTIVLDAGAIIKNEPSVSTLLQRCESLVTVPAIISEIKDANARARLETTLLPFLTLRSPNPSSVKFVTEFARRTGDLAVLSKPDIQIIALTYEIECERNAGDWRLRKVPGQKGVNGSPPTKFPDGDGVEAHRGEEKPADAAEGNFPSQSGEAASQSNGLATSEAVEESPAPGLGNLTLDNTAHDQNSIESESVTADADHTSHSEHESIPQNEISLEEPGDNHNVSDADSEGWITPSNLKKKQAEDAGASTTQSAEPKVMQVAVLTTDFAMQNVLLQINLNLLSPSLSRVKHLKTFVLRCHACFSVTKDMTKQFCPRCGQPSLTRVSCSTSANGEFKLHLKKNMQWNTRGDKYSIPKPVSGSANGKVRGGGKDGWGSGLILAEDQKEYQRAVQDGKRQKARDLMDEDYLPSILTGDRGRSGGRVKVGAGRNINSKKR